jgi:hypothetical protein
MKISTSQLNLVNNKLRLNLGGADEKRESKCLSFVLN